MSQNITDLSAIIAEEQKLAAQEYQSEAWAGGILNGIDPTILAEVAFDTALRELMRLRSEKEALALLTVMNEKVIAGHFLDKKVIQ